MLTAEDKRLFIKGLIVIALVVAVVWLVWGL
jgi:hypothetical protein